MISFVGKAFEKAIHKHVHIFILANQIITPFQSGFMPGDSTVNQLTDMYNTFCQALDEGKEVDVVFCDKSKSSTGSGIVAFLLNCTIMGSLVICTDGL